MRNREEYIAYALDFASYLISKIKNVNKIILYGSVSRGDYDEDSDIDLFIDANKKYGKKINKIVEDYCRTKKFKEWELKGIDNQISAIVGTLDSKEWKNLKRSMLNTGIILYGKFKEETEKVNHYTLITFEGIKPDKKRVAVFRKLFGFKTGKKLHPGTVKNMGGLKIGKSSILIPIEHANKLEKYFREKKIPIKLYDLWSDVKY